MPWDKFLKVSWPSKASTVIFVSCSLLRCSASTNDHSHPIAYASSHAVTLSCCCSNTHTHVSALRLEVSAQPHVLLLKALIGPTAAEVQQCVVGWCGSSPPPGLHLTEVTDEACLHQGMHGVFPPQAVGCQARAGQTIALSLIDQRLFFLALCLVLHLG